MRQPLFARRLTNRESRELLQLIRTSPNAQLVRRAQVLRLSTRGKAPRQIVDLFDLSWSGVRKIINRFNTDDFASLADKPRGGSSAQANGSLRPCHRSSAAVSLAEPQAPTVRMPVLTTALRRIV